MANPNQPTPGNRPSNESENKGSNLGQTHNPQSGNQGVRKDDGARRSDGDTTGEMDAAGGGRKDTGNPSFDPSRSNRGSSSTTAPGRPSSIEPQKGAGEGNDDDVERESSPSSERSRSKQQGC